MANDIPAIEAVIQTYFDGLYEGDTGKLARVFSPKASLFIEDQGQLIALPIPQWFERVASRASPASTGARRNDRILLVDSVGPVNAIAKVTCMVDPVSYTDYLSLIKFEGRWQIVAKAYCKMG